ncbi:MAG: metal ABC transporter substrate-binding protein [Fibrobacterota bacterium]
MKERKTARVALLLLPALFALSCNAPAPSPESRTPASAQEKVILASFYPVYIMTINIAQGVPGVRVANLTKPTTGCLHDFALKSEDMIAIAHATAFIVNGAGMESFLGKIEKTRPGLPVIDASRGIPLLNNNPHVFVSVTLAMDQVRNITEGLAGLDPANAPLYRRNSEAYLVKLTALKTRMHDSLQGLSSRDIITLHEAFPYFAQEFDLNIAAAIEKDPGSEPTAAELAVLIRTIREKKVRAIFAEPQYPSNIPGLLARETGAKTYALDPCVMGPDSPGAYIAIMDRNAAVLRKALAHP